MPLYEYVCNECGNFEHFFKSLPSEAKQTSMPCPDCDKPGKRLLSTFLTGNTQSSGIEKAMGNNALTIDVGGRPMPAFRDANGNLHEVRRMEDIKFWKKSNQNGFPRMVEWTNRKTGEKSMVPMRQHMEADPATGEPLEPLLGNNPIIKESVEMVEIPTFEMPTHTKNDVPLNSKGVVEWDKIKKVPVPGTRGLIDPSTQRPMTMGDVWGNEERGLGNRQQAKNTSSGKTTMSRAEVAQRLMSEE